MKTTIKWLIKNEFSLNFSLQSIKENDTLADEIVKFSCPDGQQEEKTVLPAAGAQGGKKITL